MENTPTSEPLDLFVKKLKNNVQSRLNETGKSFLTITCIAKITGWSRWTVGRRFDEGHFVNIGMVRNSRTVSPNQFIQAMKQIMQQNVKSHTQGTNITVANGSTKKTIGNMAI